MIKVSDFVFSHLHKLGAKQAFLISGGGAIHLVDSIGKSKIKYICNHHEQGSAIAAEAYSRINGKFGLCVVTTGPGSTNTLTGLIGAWLDSIPVVFISGQVKREIIADYQKLRQLGDQEINIIDMVKPVTKYAVTVNNSENIQYHLDKAVHLATTGRPGPVWINIPMDIQGAMVNETKLKRYVVKNTNSRVVDDKKLSKEVGFVINKLSKAKRPVLLVGNGVRLSSAHKKLLNLITLLKIPVITGFASFDMVSSENEYFAGRAGTIGQRAGNFAIQNSDLLIIIGARLNIRMIGYNYQAFAPKAYKIMADIDNEEMSKKTLSIDKKIHIDAKIFIEEMIWQLKRKSIKFNIDDWRKKIKYWKKTYPSVLPEYWKLKNYVNPYCFIETLSKYINSNDVLALSNATASICTYQALRFPQGTRVITNSGCASMGYGLPASIGAYLANPTGRTICLEGDGSIQMNIQELQTIVHNKLPIKIFVINNEGYVSIRLTQKNLFAGKYIASSAKSGVSCPDILKIAKAYGIKIKKITSHREMDKKVKETLASEEPIICEVVVSPKMEFLPKASSKKLPDGTFVSRPLEDMYPFLNPKEVEQNMSISL
ncbi:MAG: thiamine pyrophosphate-binding protein [Patescibacteria group bacterium]